jgi:hypothetical protein
MSLCKPHAVCVYPAGKNTLQPCEHEFRLLAPAPTVRRDEDNKKQTLLSNWCYIL